MKREKTPGQGGIYVRGQKLWLWYWDAALKRQWSPTGLAVGQEKTARAALERIRQQVGEEVRTGVPQGELTVEAYGRRWVADRERRGIGSAKDDLGRLQHVFPRIGSVPLDEVRPGRVRDLFRELRALVGTGEKALAPRTVRHIYGVLHRMFEDAVADELIPVNPCVLKRGELPPKMDKDPAWRAGAVYTRAEVEQLISDPRVPEQRRVLYGLLFLGGKRVGEVAALRLRSYDAEREPLGALHLATSFSRKRKKEKGLKREGSTRDVPVHPTLAKLLAGWLVGGWERYMGQRPGPDDLLVPSARGNHLRDPVVHQNLLRDLATLGFRERRTHDTRRTFISLALADGARKDVLRWVTHGPTGDIVDLYTTLPWDALCAEVGKLRLELREGRIVQMRQVANGTCDSPCDSGPQKTKKPPTFRWLEATKEVPRAGFEPAFATRREPIGGRKPAEHRGEALPLAEPRLSRIPGPVTLSRGTRTAISDALHNAASDFAASHDGAELRDRLSSILELLPLPTSGGAQ